MEFGEWEVDDSIWEKTAEYGQVQDSLPMRQERNEREVDIVAGADEADVEDMTGLRRPGPRTARAQDGLLLVDAMNGFYMLSRLSMLWMVRHGCTKMSRFAFNCYRHKIRLICRRPGNTALIILSKEGVTQGNPLAMALYGIALLPLAEKLRESFPAVMQPWYADDAAMMGKHMGNGRCFQLLIKIGPHFRYHPEPAKSFYICPLADELEAKAAFASLDLPVKFCRGHRYVGGFVGSKAMRDRWVEPMVEK